MAGQPVEEEHQVGALGSRSGPTCRPDEESQRVGKHDGDCRRPASLRFGSVVLSFSDQTIRLAVDHPLATTGVGGFDDHRARLRKREGGGMCDPSTGFTTRLVRSAR